MRREGIRYSKYDPHKVHFVGGYPYLVNQKHDLISQNDARRGFKRAVTTLHTWTARYFRLTANLPVKWAEDDSDGPRQYELEYLLWELEDIETWLAHMRSELDKVMGNTEKRVLLEKVKALEERPGHPGEGEAAKRVRARLEKELGDV